MTGNNHIIFQARDQRLHEELSIMGIADREQLKIAAGFGSTTRVNARLLQLTRAGLLRRFYLGYSGARKALYALSPKGARLAGVPCRGPRRPQETMLVADYFTEHRLVINAVYCKLKFQTIPIAGVRFHSWESFHDPLLPHINLIPDGYVEFATPVGWAANFLEVDLGHESLAVWREKARRYLRLAVSGEYQRKFGRERFRVLVVAHSDRKLHSIRKAVAEITQKIFWFATVISVENGFFEPVWFRSTGDQPTSLFEIPR